MGKEEELTGVNAGGSWQREDSCSKKLSVL